ncbi:MAG: hypothetical protein K8J31_21190 [Anaerolineae bacterium]|nr:hypothetical protein [Anaerolineae bacterium]
MSVYIVRSEISADLPALTDNDQVILLRPLEDGPAVRFQVFDTEADARAAGDDVYRLLVEVAGPWQDVPSHAVCATWKLKDGNQVDHFLENRRQLFEVRRRVLPHFVYDWLLQSLQHEDQFLVLGLYGDEDSAIRLCREHPDVEQYNRLHPLGAFSAEDVTGLRCFRVETYPA